MVDQVWLCGGAGGSAAAARRLIRPTGSIPDPPRLPKVRGKPRSDDRVVLSRIIHVKRNGLRGRDAPAVYGPHMIRLTTASCGGRGWACLPGWCVTWPSPAPGATPS